MQVIHDTASIYVPVEGSFCDGVISPGSGIVGIERDGKLFVYYDGNHLGAMNMHAGSERVICAFGRLATRYPTIAMMGSIDKDQLIRVGKITWPNRIRFDSAEAEGRFNDYMARYRRSAA